MVRVKPGSSGPIGAWMLRCPQYGGQEAVTLHRPEVMPATLTVDGPSGSDVYINDGAVGQPPVRLQLRGAFTKVTLRRGDRAVTRWVPTVQDIAVRLAFDP